MTRKRKLGAKARARAGAGKHKLGSGARTAGRGPELDVNGKDR